MSTDSDHPITDFLYKVALRARELGDMKMDELRYWACSDNDTQYSRKRETLGQSRGALIEWILLEEFEFDAQRLDHLEGP